jgi:beta-lactamase regulating signal transducer with metallopeptidase domain
MNHIYQWMQSDWSKALGWTFVHSLWQIALIGFLLYIILRLIPGRSAHVRYTISTMAFWFIVIVVLSTFIIMLPESRSVTEVTGQVILVKTQSSISFIQKLSYWLEARMPMMLTIWLGGVLILMLRLVFSLGWIAQMRSVAIPMDSLQLTLNELIHRLQIRIKPFASESNYVSSPVTIGHLKPLILFPVGIINQLTPQEVEAILTHELAHIVRRDYLSNLVQTFIETLFYYHPVTWWISNMVRIERENRADDLAISWCGDHLGYAKALLTVQEMQTGNQPSLAIGFASRKGAMLTRIQRILHIPYKNHNQMEKTVLISLCSLCFLGFTLNSQPQEDAQKENNNTTELVSYRVPVADSIPSSGTYRIHKKTDDQDISIEVKDGDIKELQIDGKQIEPAEFDQYGEVIDELFGTIETPPSMEDFTFEMPPMPEMPEMPSLPPPGYSFSYAFPPMPAMPPMPEMNELEIERLLGEGSNLKILNSDDIDEYIKNQVEGRTFHLDSIGPNKTKIIIIRDGDSTVIESDKLKMKLPKDKEYKMYMYGNGGNEDFNKYLQQGEDWKQHQEEWQKMAEEWKQNWEEHAREWKDQWREQQEEMRAAQEGLRSQGYNDLEEERERMNQGDYQRAREAERLYGGFGRGEGHRFWAPQMDMSESMIEDGFVDPGEEAEVILTPDKLKINGKRMPDDVHKKYLRMYEEQQGVELSGNSRVEFKIKSRRSM